MRIPLVVFAILLCCIGFPVSATAVPVVQEELYGTVVYTNITPVPAGSTIVVSNQTGNVVGSYTLVEDGVYGSSHPADDRLVVTTLLDDWLYFTVDGVRVDGHRTIVPAWISQYDLVVPVTPPEVIEPTVEPTVEPTTEPVMEPTEPMAEMTMEPVPTETTAPVMVTIPAQITIPWIQSTVPLTSGILLVCLGALIVVFALVTTVYFIYYRKTKDTETLDF
jgi:hypothetical protein